VKKVVINTDFGGFGLSEKAEALYKAYAGIAQDSTDWYDWMLERNDPILVQVIEQLGINEASGRYANLKIVEIPDDVEWELVEHDGKEYVAECHRTWS